DDRIVDAEVDERFGHQSQELEPPTVHDIGRHVEGHRENGNPHTDQEEAQPRNLMQVLWIQKQKWNAQHDTKLLKNHPQQNHPYADQSQGVSQMKEKKLYRRTV